VNVNEKQIRDLVADKPGLIPGRRMAYSTMLMMLLMRLRKRI